MYILENPTRSVVTIRVVYNKSDKEVYTIQPYKRLELEDREFQLIEGDKTQNDAFKQLIITRVSDKLADTTEEIVELIHKAFDEQGFDDPIELLPDQGNQQGNSGLPSRADHVHNIPTNTPSGIPLDAPNQQGSSNSFSRADHIHQLNTAAPISNLSGSTTNQKGSASTVSRSDHVHSIQTGNPTTVFPDQPNGAGNSAALARANHIHNILTAAPSTSLSADTNNSRGSTNNFSRADHVHAILTASPVTIGSSNQIGTSSELARADHVHDHGNQEGGSTHPDVTDTTSGFMSANQKIKLDGRKSGLVSHLDFSGTPQVATVTFNTPMPDLNYSIVISGENSRVWSYQNKTINGFVINTNANQPLTGEVSWQATRIGE